MNYRSLSVPKRIVSSKEAIVTVIEDPELNGPLSSKGYPAEELAIGLGLQEAALTLFQTRFVDFGTGVDSTKAMYDQSRSIRRFAVAHRAAARAALKGEAGLIQKLRLLGPIERNRDNMLLQVRHFYSEIVALPEILEKVAPYGITAEVATARLNDVDALEAAMNDMQRRRAEARTMKVRRDEAIEELDEWTIRFLGTARLVFRKQPEQLEKLGL